MKLVAGWLIALAFGVGVPTVSVSSCLAQSFQPRESGVVGHISGSVEGITYSYDVDLSGDVEGGEVDGPIEGFGTEADDADRWVVQRKRDDLTDRVDWYIVQHRTGLMLGMGATGAIRSVCLIEADFPGRPIAVRIGTAPAFQFSEDCSSTVPPTFRAQLMKGGALLTRGYEWPLDVARDKNGNADTFSRAMKLYLFLRTGRQ